MTRKTTKLEEAICDRCGVMVVNPGQDWSFMEVWDRRDGEYVDRATEFGPVGHSGSDLCPDCRWALKSWYRAGKEVVK